MPRITFHGHACFLMEHDRHRVMIDPFLTGNPKAVIGPKDVPQLAGLLVSHGHGDHLGDAVELSRRDQAPIVAPYELAEFCESKGATVHAMHIGGAHEFPFGRVKLVAAVHGGAVEGDDGSHTTHACGFVLTMGGVRIYHCGDTALTMDMQLLQGRVDVMLAPIGDNYTMGIEDAVRAVEMVKPKIVIPMHFGTFPVIAVNPADFRESAARFAKVEILQPGQSFTC